MRLHEKDRSHKAASISSRRGRALLSTHANFRDAEDAALRYWLGPKAKGHDDD